MNKHCFRLVFSKPLGFLIPVAEITRAQRKPGQQPAATPVILSPTEPFSWSLKRLVLSVLLAGAPGWAMADILVDPTAPAGGTNVINAGNGVPVIEIANPNAKGLSHNRFSQFDVQQPGVIFNNSRANGVSQIGGAVLLNPNLQRTATAILTEVTGNKPSSLSGTLEVFGDKADLLIAKARGAEEYRAR
ncbi:MAG: filamentous hemagglutinin N-terminal domain-containing protein [Pseudomonas sp.]|uniref:two-partner secretion domain-containing protein n=1 Tax=Pseudomonas sp. TaxID=306 RepID=UPI0030F262EE